jgi:hypothetical protein
MEEESCHQVTLLEAVMLKLADFSVGDLKGLMI